MQSLSTLAASQSIMAACGSDWGESNTDIRCKVGQLGQLVAATRQAQLHLTLFLISIVLLAIYARQTPRDRAPVVACAGLCTVSRFLATPPSAASPN